MDVRKRLLNKHVISPAKYISDVYMGIELYKRYGFGPKYPEINTVVNDFINRALEGMIDNFNTEWQQYIEQLYSAGLEEIIKKYLIILNLRIMTPSEVHFKRIKKNKKAVLAFTRIPFIMAYGDSLDFEF